jgi:hypothetical protein
MAETSAGIASQATIDRSREVWAGRVGVLSFIVGAANEARGNI